MPPVEPMLATLSRQLPVEDGLLYEPKWDGFRCLVFRDHSTVELQSKAQKSLTRYFPEVAAAVRALRPPRFALDGELVVPSERGLSFDALLQRVHPAASRVEKLAAETPALLLVFDLLATGEKTSLLEAPLERRRPRLQTWAERYLGEESDGTVRLSPATVEREVALEWLEKLRGVDGVVSKDLDAPYRAGRRDAMVKIKRIRTADCVVGGFRRSSTGDGVGSLLLGLFDDEGRLHHVGFTSGLTDAQRVELLDLLEPFVEEPGFTGRAPGGPSRWSRDGGGAFEPLRPELVVEVAYDHVSGGRFRHGTRFERWRPDKAPRQCTLDQIEMERSDAMRLLEGAGAV
ncbi:MAG: ATP-dependent DNA ligase [Gemmatimonadetes bacterium]|nr:ATP-dependent DNA ligase [Gemmatimonadota bacterium]